MKTFAEFEDDVKMFDLTNAGSLPAFTVEKTVAQVKKIVEEASEIQKKRRKEFIVNSHGLPIFIPFIGPTGSGAIATGVRTLLRLVEVGPEVGVAVLSVINDPESAFMTIFSTLLGAGFSRGGFRDAARLRRGMGSADYNSLGDVKERLDAINKLRGGICPL